MALELDPTLLGILACPACHSNLSVDYEAKELICASQSCALAYPIRENIPIMLVDEARDTRPSRGFN
ncbi:MAG: Trm112 family protein [Propionibacteriaceae bacterium]|nr:Trm112 family protein [Propionibacteriaceae bacterium]